MAAAADKILRYTCLVLPVCCLHEKLCSQGGQVAWRLRRLLGDKLANLGDCRSLAVQRFALEDGEPVHVKDRVWIGSIGAASNHSSLRANGAEPSRAP